MNRQGLISATPQGSKVRQWGFASPVASPTIFPDTLLELSTSTCDSLMDSTAKAAPATQNQPPMGELPSATITDTPATTTVGGYHPALPPVKKVTTRKDRAMPFEEKKTKRGWMTGSRETYIWGCIPSLLAAADRGADALNLEVREVFNHYWYIYGTTPLGKEPVHPRRPYKRGMAVLSPSTDAKDIAKFVSERNAWSKVSQQLSYISLDLHAYRLFDGAC